MEPVPTLEQLVRSLEAAPGGPLDRVRVAVTVADELAARGDALVTHFVQAARASGCSWAQIGGELGVSKQAAQQAFVAPARRRRGRAGRRHPAPATTPFERWSEQARQVMVAAQDEARALGHEYLGTEHVLLGLGEGQGLAAQALARLGVDREAVRELVVELIGRGAGAPGGALAFTPRTKKVLELAVREADRQRADVVETEHVLLALVREGEGVAAQILVKLGTDLRRVRQTLLDLLDENGRPPTSGGRRIG